MINSSFPLLIYHVAHHNRHFLVFVDRFRCLALIVYESDDVTLCLKIVAAMAAVCER